MANATIALGGLVGLSVAIPVIASTVPTKEMLSGAKQWYPLDEAEFKQLQKSTDKPIKIFFQHKVTDGYIVTTNPEYVWGLKLDASGEAKLRSERADVFASKEGAVPFPVINMGFVMFSPICPHLSCHFNWDDASNQFVCPCHGSTYTRYGKHLLGPAPRGLDPLPFQEKSGVAEITWIDYRTLVPSRLIVSYS
jgi:Rieske Fe-S protein